MFKRMTDKEKAFRDQLDAEFKPAWSDEAEFWLKLWIFACCLIAIFKAF